MHIKLSISIIFHISEVSFFVILFFFPFVKLSSASEPSILIRFVFLFFQSYSFISLPLMNVRRRTLFDIAAPYPVKLNQSLNQSPQNLSPFITMHSLSTHLLAFTLPPVSSLPSRPPHFNSTTSPNLTLHI